MWAVMAVFSAMARQSRDAGERVVLDRLQESETRAVAFDFQVHEDVFRAAVSEEIRECFCVDLEVDVLGALAVNHGGNPAFTAHLFEASSTAACARCCLECCLLGHIDVGVGI